MKKKLLSSLAVLAVAAVAAWNVNFNSQTDLMSDVVLENVEALAQENNSECPNGCFENGRGCYCYVYYKDELEAVK